MWPRGGRCRPKYGVSIKCVVRATTHLICFESTATWPLTSQELAEAGDGGVEGNRGLGNKCRPRKVLRMSWNTLPPFLLCEGNPVSEDDRVYVMHTRSPRFLMEFVPGGEGDFLPIDPAEESDFAPLREKTRAFFNDEV